MTARTPGRASALLVSMEPDAGAEPRAGQDLAPEHTGEAQVVGVNGLPPVTLATASMVGVGCPMYFIILVPSLI